MSYANTTGRPNPLAVVGAMGVPTLFGAVLIAGLAVTQVITPPIPNPTGTNIPDVVEITPEVIEVDIPPSASDQPSTSTPKPTDTAPQPDTRFNFASGPSGPVVIAPTGPIAGAGTGTGPMVLELPPVAPLFDPVAAAPRGNPGRWITTSDYRTSWINRGYEGTAGFTLSLDQSGRVTDCAITSSTGVEALDKATCTLLRQRARFEPARGTNGEPVASRYASTVTWNIPE